MGDTHPDGSPLPDAEGAREVASHGLIALVGERRHVDETRAHLVAVGARVIDAADEGAFHDVIARVTPAACVVFVGRITDRLVAAVEPALARRGGAFGADPAPALVVVVDRLPRHQVGYAVDGGASFVKVVIARPERASQVEAVIASALAVRAEGARLAASISASFARAPAGPLSSSALEQRYAREASALTAALSWLAPTTSYRDDALVVRVTHADVQELSLELVVKKPDDGRTTSVAVTASGALPASAGGRSSIAPERGLAGKLMRIGEVTIGVPAVDERFIIGGDATRAREWGAAADALPPLADVATMHAIIDVDSFSCAGAHLDEKTLPRAAAAMVETWQALARGRLGDAARR